MIKERTADLYHIGDKVIVSETVKDNTVIQEIINYIGREATIVGYEHNGYLIDIDDGDWIWFDQNLDLIEQPIRDDIQDIGLLDFLGVL